MIGCWPSYNRSLVRSGEILFSHDFLDTGDSELERMNEKKLGKPFTFPNSFILAIGYIRYSFRLPYRQTEEIINNTSSLFHGIISFNNTDSEILSFLNNALRVYEETPEIHRTIWLVEK